MALRTKKTVQATDKTPAKQEKQPDEDVLSRIPAEDKDVIDMSSLTRVVEGEDTTAGGEDTTSGVAADVELVDLEIDGKSFKVSKDARDALAGFVTKRVPDTRPAPKELDEKPLGKKADEEFLPGFKDADLFIRPTEFLAAFAGKIREDVKREVRGEYTADQSQKEFWSNFYGENKDLAGHKQLVNTVMMEHKEELAPLTVTQAKKKLAELTRGSILDIVKQFGGDNKGGMGRERVEGSTSGSGRKSAASQQDAAPSSISATIKARQAARRAARLQTLN